MAKDKMVNYNISFFFKAKEYFHKQKNIISNSEEIFQIIASEMKQKYKDNTKKSDVEQGLRQVISNSLILKDGLSSYFEYSEKAFKKDNIDRFVIC